MKKLIFIAFIFIVSAAATFAQMPPRPSQHPGNQSNFRGQRNASESQDFSLLSVNATSTENGILIDLLFSSAVDPQSLNERTIFINSNPLPKQTRFSFNRDGTKVRFCVADISNNSVIKLKGVKSLEGTPLPPSTSDISY